MKYIKQILSSTLLFFFIIQSLFSQETNKGIDEISQRKFDYYYYSALNAKVLNKYADALDYLRHCMSIDSTNASVLIELGAYYSSLGNQEKSIEYVNKALKYNPDNYYYNMLAAEMKNQFGNKAETVNIFRHLLKVYPAKVELYMNLANAYSENGQNEKAIEALDSLQKFSGDNPTIALNKFRIFNLMNKKDEAFSEILKIVDKNPDNIRYHLLLGDLYLQDNQFDKAGEAYNKAKALDAEDPGLVLSLINFYERTGNKEASTQEIENAISNRKMDIEEKLQIVGKYIAVLRQNKQDTKKANSLFDQLFDQYPNNSEINMLFGELLLIQEDKENALKQFEIFKSNNPEEPAGYSKILEIIISSDSTQSNETLEKIKEITSEGIKNVPTSPEFYFYNAMAELQQNKLKEGMDILQLGLDKATFNNPIIQSEFNGQIGDIHHMLKDDTKAFEYYEQALELNPYNLHVLNNYSYYLSVKKIDLDKAEKMSAITVKAEPTNATYLDTYAWILFEQESYVLSKIYIEKAIEYGKDDISAEVYEHYGDILAMSGDIENAVEQWKKAKELGNKSKILNKKIKRKKYYTK